MHMTREKKQLRQMMRTLRREHVAALPDGVRGLIFSRPPAPVVDMIAANATIGIYCATDAEAPTQGYARWFHENGYALALPWFADRQSGMQFREWRNPYDNEELVTGPFGMLQPHDEAPQVVPDVAFMPLLAFTAKGDRLGQGGGHYDKWLSDHAGALPIGMAWDCQLVDTLPVEIHDHTLSAVITPTRLYSGAA